VILDKPRLRIYAAVFCLAAAFGAHEADAAEVYSGCAVPPTKFNHIWYIDPVNGQTQSAGGDGSQAHPWSSLQAMFATQPGYKTPLLSTAPYRHPNPNPGGQTVWAGPPLGPVNPGDEILLMSGNYGDTSIGYWNIGVNNPSFVTIAAAPGQAPVLTSLLISASSGFVFSGLKVQSLGAGRIPLVAIIDRGETLRTSNIVLDNLNVSSAEPSVYATWTQAQWQANTRVGVSAKGSNGGANTTCVSVVDSHISANHWDLEVFANNMLVSGNEIDHFGDDGIDYGASNILMTRNYIHDSMDWKNGAHMDGMQGYPGKFTNVVIDSNRIVRQADPNLTFPTYLQGIDAFDGDWDNLKVTNNVVLTSSCWGIGFASVHGGRIINNTVVSDESRPQPGDCKPLVAVGDKTHDGSSSNDVVIRNNLSNGLSIYSSGPNMVMDHNICAAIKGKCRILTYVNGKPQWGTYKPGMYGDHNVIDARGNPVEFVNYDPDKLAYDLRLKAGARAIGTGNPEGAPAVDVTGAARGNPVDIGAYRYNPGK
jgi:hypothetical protein